MTAPAVNDVWQVGIELKDSESGERALVVPHYKLTVYSSGNSLQVLGANLAQAIETFLETNMPSQTWISSLAQLVCCTAQRISPAGSRIFINYAATTVLGGGTGTMLPAQIAVLCSKYTSILNQSGRGRIYWPFIDSNAQDSGVLDSTNFSQAVNFLDSLLEETLMIAGGDEMEGVVWSRKNSTATEIDDVEVRPVLATQRRRRDPHQPVSS